MEAQSNFSTYIPLKLTKSINENGQEVMKMSGVMSSTSRDKDGQILDPSGFDMEEFMNEGYMNWHHQQNKNPLAIIGRPTSYKLDKARNEMNLDFELFPENPMSQQVFQLQKILESQGLYLGLSLEGKATKFKNDTTKDFVEKARITGCAVTPAPKNKDAVVKLMKAQTEEFDLIKGDILSEGSGSKIGEGKHPILPESLEGVTKKEEKEKEEDKEKNKEQKLTKSEVIDYVGKKFPESDYQTLEKFFRFTLVLEKSDKTSIMNTTEKSQENKVDIKSVDKALEVLELQKGTEAKKVESEEPLTIEARMDKLEKGLTDVVDLLKGGFIQNNKMKKSEDEEEEEKEEDMEKGKMKKGDEKEMEKGKDCMEKGDLVIKHEDDDDEGDEKKVEKGNMKKGEDNLGGAELIKGMLEKFEVNIGGKVDTFNEKLEKATTEMGEGLNKIDALAERLEKAESDLEELGKQPLTRKTVSTKSYLKKAGESDQGSADLNVLHPVGDKRYICDLLEKGCISDGRITDQKMANAVMQFEQSNVVTNYLVKGLEREGYSLQTS